METKKDVRYYLRQTMLALGASAAIGAAAVVYTTNPEVAPTVHAAVKHHKKPGMKDMKGMKHHKKGTKKGLKKGHPKAGHKAAPKGHKHHAK